MLTKKKRENLAERLKNTENRCREGANKIFYFYYDVIDILDLSMEVKLDLWRKACDLACYVEASGLDAMIVREKLEA